MREVPGSIPGPARFFLVLCLVILQILTMVLWRYEKWGICLFGNFIRPVFVG